MLACAACGGTVSGTSSNDAGPTDGASAPADGGATDAAAGDAGATCPIGDPAGAKFTLHVTNGGARALSLAYGCGALPPIALDTPTGTSQADPFGINTCGIDCKAAYGGQGVGACSDCGPGYGAALDAGATVDLTWDRRVYVAQEIVSACVGGQPIPSGVSCALEQAVPPSASQKGTLTICAKPSGLGLGYCSTTEPVPFTIDTTGAEATIQVK
jgi:hypothetical protein